MPITSEFPLKVFDNEGFHAIDKRVLAIAFGVHNELGRFLPEKLYQHEIAHRCREQGLQVVREARILVSHHDFQKEYFVDLLAEEGVVVELKAVESLTVIHRKQVLNYLYLLGLHHGSLINLRPTSVVREFISTSLNHADRRAVRWIMDEWRPLSAEFRRLETIIAELLGDWGSFLVGILYREAVTHFLGGRDSVVRNIPIIQGSRVIGEQETHLLCDDVAFALTTAHKNVPGYAVHLRRFLNHTRLQAIAWVNLNRQQIEFRTLTR